MTPTRNNVEPTTSATDELSRMLDERGKEHRVWPSGLVIWHDEGSWVYEYSPPKGDDDYWGGILHATLRHCTPEQAIEATLGRGTCHITVQDNMTETEGMGDVWLECDACGWQMPLEPSTPRFNYCPNCGRKVVDA